MSGGRALTAPQGSNEAGAGSRRSRRRFPTGASRPLSLRPKREPATSFGRPAFEPADRPAFFPTGLADPQGGGDAEIAPAAAPGDRVFPPGGVSSHVTGSPE